MKRYKSHFEEGFANIAVSCQESLYNLIGMYKQLEKEECKNKKKHLKKLKCILVELTDLDYRLAKELNYDSLAKKYMNIR